MNTIHNKKRDSNFNTPYDDAHQTMVTECPTLLIPVVKVQEYTVDELFEKELYFFIPFHIFAYEKEFDSFEKDGEKLRKLQRIYVNIVERLDEHARQGKLTGFEKRTVIAMA